ncbi:efflux RND transporter periplasmic adaptor subunit [candidate division KSB1 bacterium]|nr:efflux RND transporter periplasmic adaptor subunit [candidate division KSB1 bacterium]
MYKFSWIMAVMLGLVLNCQRQPQSAAPAASVEKSVPVKVVAVRDTLIVETVKVTGELRPLYQVDIFPKSNGLVVKELVTTGREVQPEQLLAEFIQDIPGMTFAPVKITATNAGVITMDAVEAGGRVTAQKACYTISQIRPIDLVVQVVESLLGQVKVGTPGMIQIDAFPTEKFQGRVAEISPLVDPTSRTAEIKLRFNNPNLRLKPGMFGMAYLKLGMHPGVIVPLDAMVRSGVRQFLFRIEAGRAQQLTVQTGVIMGDWLEIKGALKAGDAVVVLGQTLIEDGTAVQIVKD